MYLELPLPELSNKLSTSSSSSGSSGSSSSSSSSSSSGSSSGSGRSLISFEADLVFFFKYVWSFNYRNFLINYKLVRVVTVVRVRIV